MITKKMCYYVFANWILSLVKHLIHLKSSYIHIPEIQLRKFKFLLEKKVWSMDGDFIAQTNALEGIKLIMYIMSADM